MDNRWEQSLVVEDFFSKDNATDNYRPISRLPLMRKSTKSLITVVMSIFHHMNNVLPMEKKRWKGQYYRIKDQLFIDRIPIKGL